MAVSLRELITKIGFQVDEKGADAAEKKVKGMSLGMKTAIGAVVTGIFALGAASLRAAGDMEMLTTQFEVMLGSTEAAVSMMDELKSFAASTPFALEDLATGTQQLLSFGVAENDVIDAMKLLGDTAGGNAEKLNGLVLAYGKVQAKGKASMEEINMLTERGVPIISTLREQLGVTEDAFFKLVSAGKIGRDDITQAFRTMTSEGGMFFEGMKKQSLTFQGLISTMKDNLKLLLADIGSTLLPVAKQIVGIITNLIQGPLGEVVSSIVSLLAPVLGAVGVLLEDIISALLPVTDILKSIMPLITLALEIIIFAVHWVSKMVGWILKGASSWVAKVVPILMFLIKWVKNIVFIYIFLYKQIFRLFQMVFGQLNELRRNIFSFIGDGIGSGFQKIMGWITAIGNHVFEVIKFLTGIFSIFWDWLAGKFPWLATLVNAIGSVFIGMWDTVKNVFLGMWDAVVSGIQRVIGWIKKIPGVEIDIPDLDSGDGSGGGGGSIANGLLSASANPEINPAITAAGRTANIDMQNNITVAVPPGSNTEAIKGAVEAAARAVFTVELQKLIVDTGI